MSRDEVLNILREHTEELRTKYRVKFLGLFGSVARDEATETSDVDLTVEFENGQDLFGYIDTKEYLEKILGISVDLVSRGRIKKRIREQILAEEIPVG